MAARSVWARVVDALVDTLRALPGWAGPGEITAATTVLVLDGPEALTEDTSSGLDRVIVGAGDDLTGDTPDEAGDAGQAVATLAPSTRPRDETGTVRLQVLVSDGDTAAGAVRAVRTRAWDVLGGIEGALQADPTIGLGPQVLHTCQVTDISVTQAAATTGTACVLRVVASYRARI